LLASAAGDDGALWREFGRDFRMDLSMWREQLAHAPPFARPSE
jgi:hypothetical protein